jgi:hypothetical protein
MEFESIEQGSDPVGVGSNEGRLSEQGIAETFEDVWIGGRLEVFDLTFDRRPNHVASARGLKWWRRESAKMLVDLDDDIHGFGVVVGSSHRIRIADVGAFVDPALGSCGLQGSSL